MEDFMLWGGSPRLGLGVLVVCISTWGDADGGGRLKISAWIGLCIVGGRILYISRSAGSEEN